jgi:uncharacterized protein (DUF58 family)
MAASATTHLPAGGTDVTGSRDYAPGDDLRRVDWNVCARHDELVVKRYCGETDEHFYVLLDVSASMATGEPAKFDIARWSVAALGYLAMARMARFCVFSFSDRIREILAPLRDKFRVVSLLAFLESLSTKKTSTDLFRATEAFVKRPQRRGPVVVVSDFYDSHGFQSGLDFLRRSGYTPRVLRTLDPAEAEPEILGDTELVDVESRSRWQLTITERHRTRYRQLFEDHRRALQHYAATYSLPYAEICTDLSQEQILLKAVGAKP